MLNRNLGSPLGSPIGGHEAWNHHGAMEDHWMRSGATHNQISFFLSGIVHVCISWYIIKIQ